MIDKDHSSKISFAEFSSAVVRPQLPFVCLWLWQSALTGMGAGVCSAAPFDPFVLPRTLSSGRLPQFKNVSLPPPPGIHQAFFCCGFLWVSEPTEMVLCSSS